MTYDTTHTHTHTAAIIGVVLGSLLTGYGIGKYTSSSSSSTSSSNTAVSSSTNTAPAPCSVDAATATVTAVIPAAAAAVTEEEEEDKSPVVPLEKLTDSAYLRTTFLDLYDTLKQQIVDDLRSNLGTTQEFIEYITRMMDYTLIGGKMNRGLAAVDTFAAFMVARNSNTTTLHMLHRACVVGWCIEWMQAFFLVADDLMDQSQVRRGSPCWYKLSDVGLVACNDYITLEGQLFRLLKLWFGGSSDDAALYGSLVDLFHETIYQTEMGQLYDTRAQLPGRESKHVDLDRCTMDRYKTIVQFKTAYYSFVIPVLGGLLLCGSVARDAAVVSCLRRVLLAMGEYFQIQDDYLDCYGSEEVIGKVGRDIEEGKCCWIVVRALELIRERMDSGVDSDVEQATNMMRILEECYGVDDAAAVRRVKEDVYAVLGMDDHYRAYEDEAIAEMERLIHDSDDVKSIADEGNRVLVQEVLQKFLRKITKRNK